MSEAATTTTAALRRKDAAVAEASAPPPSEGAWGAYSDTHSVVKARDVLVHPNHVYTPQTVQALLRRSVCVNAKNAVPAYVEDIVAFLEGRVGRPRMCCREGHPLRRHRRRSKQAACDLCGRAGTGFSCHRCDYDVCKPCWDAFEARQTSPLDSLWRNRLPGAFDLLVRSTLADGSAPTPPVVDLTPRVLASGIQSECVARLCDTLQLDGEPLLPKAAQLPDAAQAPLPLRLLAWRQVLGVDPAALEQRTCPIQPGEPLAEVAVHRMRGQNPAATLIAAGVLRLDPEVADGFAELSCAELNERRAGPGEDDQPLALQHGAYPPLWARSLPPRGDGRQYGCASTASEGQNDSDEGPVDATAINANHLLDVQEANLSAFFLRDSIPSLSAVGASATVSAAVALSVPHRPLASPSHPHTPAPTPEQSALAVAPAWSPSPRATPGTAPSPSPASCLCTGRRVHHRSGGRGAFAHAKRAVGLRCR